MGKVQNYLPIYTLFQSDRKNSDGDSEVQDPLKEAVKQILNDPKLQIKFTEIANSLTPVIPSAENLKWLDVFKNVSISGDENIPINKRGSGVKRLVLLNFFRAEADRRRTENNVANIIYAIEEPETAQHTNHQKKLIKAFKELANLANTQIILTSHSASLVKELEFNHLRLITCNGSGKIVQNVQPNSLPYPSLNEVNYLAFSEITEEYHNELYGFIEHEGELSNFKTGKSTVSYNKLKKNGTIDVIQIILTEYIRHQIHHPENTNNSKFTFEDLENSINLMRSFVQQHSII